MRWPPVSTRGVGAGSPRALLARLLETPHLERVVPELEPAVLYRLVRQIGLEDAGEIVTLATAKQLELIFDEDLWRGESAGQDERLDPDRFGLWLEVLAEADPVAAASQLAGMDLDFLTAAIGQHVLVDVHQTLDHGLSQEVGRYTIVARRGEHWEAVLSVLRCLEEHHHELFEELILRCHGVAVEPLDACEEDQPEPMTAADRLLGRLAEEREDRRESSGYVPPPQAAAFLSLCRRGEASTGPDLVTVDYFRRLDRRTRGSGEGPPPNPVSGRRAGFKRPGPLETLLREGTLGEPRLSLPPAGPAPGPSLPWIRSELDFLRRHDTATYARRTAELAYLTNVLISGCSFQSRRFRPAEATRAALATCNLGLESWRGAGAAGPRPGLLRRRDMMAVFRIGWGVLYRDVVLYVAARLVVVLSNLHCSDAELQEDLVDLRERLQAQVKAGTPWRERDNLDAIAILDPPSWATLLGLVDECPVVPGDALTATRRPRALRLASTFEFISEKRHVDWVREFVASLPAGLAGG
jgi:hypothetical protein